MAKIAYLSYLPSGSAHSAHLLTKNKLVLKSAVLKILENWNVENEEKMFITKDIEQVFGNNNLVYENRLDYFSLYIGEENEWF